MKTLKASGQRLICFSAGSNNGGGGEGGMGN